MARRNKFLEMEMNLDVVPTNDDFTSTLVQELDKENNENSVQMLDPDELVPYFDEKLRLNIHSGEKRQQLKESIKLNGIMQPLIVTIYKGKIMILSGHNRADIAKELKIKVPCIFKYGLTIEQMNLIVIDNNILNRQVIEELKPSQLAYLFKTKMDSEKHQGTLFTGFTKLTGDKIGEEMGISRVMVHKYIRLNNLTLSALNMTDNKDMTMKTAYELSFFEKSDQELIVDFYINNKINEKVLNTIRKELQEKDFHDSDIRANFIKSRLYDLGIREKKQRHVIDYRNIKDFIPSNIGKTEVEAYIIRALKAYQNKE